MYDVHHVYYPRLCHVSAAPVDLLSATQPTHWSRRAHEVGRVNTKLIGSDVIGLKRPRAALSGWHYNRDGFMESFPQWCALILRYSHLEGVERYGICTALLFYTTMGACIVREVWIARSARWTECIHLTEPRVGIGHCRFE